MKNWPIRFREVDTEAFEQIRRGEKTIETRAASPLYRAIQESDFITFICGDKRTYAKVLRKHHFQDIETLLEELPLSKIMPELHTLEEAKRHYASFPSYREKIQKFGILAFELGSVIDIELPELEIEQGEQEETTDKPQTTTVQTLSFTLGGLTFGLVVGAGAMYALTPENSCPMPVSEVNAIQVAPPSQSPRTLETSGTTLGTPPLPQETTAEAAATSTTAPGGSSADGTAP